MSTVKLRNGAEEFEPLVVNTLVTLKALWEQSPIFLYDLTMMARNRDYVPFPPCRAGLIRTGLVTPRIVDGKAHPTLCSMHDSIRNIVLSSFVGDGMDMEMVSPLAPTESSSVPSPA
jgi:hypothetical protein